MATTLSCNRLQISGGFSFVDDTGAKISARPFTWICSRKAACDLSLPLARSVAQEAVILSTYSSSSTTKRLGPAWVLKQISKDNRIGKGRINEGIMVAQDGVGRILIVSRFAL